MITLIKIFSFLTIVSCVFGDGIQVEDKISKPKLIVHEFNLNKFFDIMLPNIRRYITKNGFDPMEIPDVELALSPFPDVLKTKVHLHHGWVQELSTIYRSGDIIFQWTKERASLYANIGFETLDLSHEYFLRYMLYEREGDCYGRYHNVNASLLIDVNLKEYKINLRFFKFTAFGDFKLKLEGNSSDKLLNALIKVVTKLFRSQVLQLIQDKAYEVIEEQINDFNDIIPKNITIKVKEVEEGSEFKDLVLNESSAIDYTSRFHVDPKASVSMI